MIDICNHINLNDIILKDSVAPFAISWQFEDNGLEAVELLKPDYEGCNDLEIRFHYSWNSEYSSKRKRYSIVSHHLLIDVTTM